MERKRIEKIVALLLVGILIPVSLFPFRINADTITASNINLNTSLISVNYDHSPNFYNYEYEFVFDKQYVGWVSVKVVSTYYTDNNFTQSQYTFTRAIYVNGGTASITNGFYSTGNFSGGCLVSASFSVVNSNVIEYSVISSLDQITDILSDVSNYVSIDVLQELEDIVSNTSLSNDYLELISQYRQWNFPFESYNFISYWFSKNRPLIDYYDVNNYYTFPRFKMNANDYIIDQYYVNASSTGNTYVDVVLLIQHTGSTIQPFTSNMTLQAYTNLNYFVDDIYGYSYLRKYTFITTSSGNKYIRYPHEAWVTPIFIGYSSNQIYRVTTDFAIRFGLNNQLLNDVHIIAMGTNQSSSASGSLDQTTSQFSDDANDLITIEESFNDSMNDSLENVSPVFNMGSSFLTSANWVSQQFNRIVNNTPFASLITFGLTLGLGLLIIGKVRK